MDINELAGTIVREVLSQLRGTARKACIVVLENRDPHLAAMVQEALDEDVDIIFCGEDTAGRTPLRYILPHVTCSAMADLAAGRADTPVLQETLRLLLAGVQVEALEFEYKAYSETAPGPLYSLYAQHEKTLAGYGLKLFVHKKPKTMPHRQNLVTEAVVLHAVEAGACALAVPRGAVVTPLAAEVARNNNISILKQL